MLQGLIVGSDAKPLLERLCGLLVVPKERQRSPLARVPLWCERAEETDEQKTIYDT